MADRTSDVPAQRRFGGGARHEASERVTLKRSGLSIDGWTLNVSRGGLRVVVEEPLEVGGVYDVCVGIEAEGAEPARRARVVWVREQADGQIVGVEYLDGGQSETPDADS